MRDDLALSCNDPTHAAWQGVAGFMFVVYPLGVPALFAWLLWRARRRGEEVRGSDDDPLAFIQAAYEAEYAVLSKRLMNGYSKGNAGQSPVSKIVNPDPMPVPPAARTQRQGRAPQQASARMLSPGPTRGAKAA